MALRYKGAGGASPAQLGKVFIDSSDTTLGFLASKLSAGTNISLAVLNPGANELLQINAVSLLTLETVLNPKTVDASGQGPGVAAKASASDHTHQLANPITGAVLIHPSTDVVPLTLQGGGAGTADLLDILNTAGGNLFKIIPSTSGQFSLFASGEANAQTLLGLQILQFGPGAGTALDTQLSRLGQGIVRITPIGGTGLAGLEVLGNEASAAVRRYTENAGRAVIQDSSGTHKNDIERTRLTLSSAFNSVGAGVTVNDVEFMARAGVLKVWYIGWVGSGAPAGTTFLELFDVTTGATIQSTDTAINGLTSDPSSNLVITSVTIGVSGEVIALRRRNASAKTAFTYGGLMVISIAE